MKIFLKRTTRINTQNGFTLIEIMIVILLLGVLTAVIVPNLSRFLGSGAIGAANAEWVL